MVILLPHQTRTCEILFVELLHVHVQSSSEIFYFRLFAYFIFMHCFCNMHGNLKEENKKQ